MTLLWATPSATRTAAPRLPARKIKARVLADMARSELFLSLRSAYLDLIHEHDVPCTDNLKKLNDWLTYVFYCHLIRYFVPDPTARIVDWGGLYGHVTEILRAMGYHDTWNYLLQVMPQYRLFRDSFHIPTIYGSDPNVLNVETGSADVLISSGVLEHVTEDGKGEEERILAEIRGVLKPDGLFFIWNCPTWLGTSELLRIAARKWHHRHRFTTSKIRRLLANAGFEILYFDKHKFFPGSFMQVFNRWANPVKLMRIDDTLSHCPPFSFFARDFGIVARKAPAPAGL